MRDLTSFVHTHHRFTQLFARGWLQFSGVNSLNFHEQNFNTGVLYYVAGLIVIIEWAIGMRMMR